MPAHSPKPYRSITTTQLSLAIHSRGWAEQEREEGGTIPRAQLRGVPTSLNK